MVKKNVHIIIAIRNGPRDLLQVLVYVKPTDNQSPNAMTLYEAGY